MSILGVDAVTLGVENVDDAARFYTDFGLKGAGRGADFADFIARNQTEILVRDLRSEGLPSAVTGGSTIREVTWGARDEASLQQIAVSLAKDRPVTQDADGTLHAYDEDGYGIAFRVSRTHAAPVVNRVNVYGGPPNRPINTRVDFLEALEPTAIAHVVLITPDVPRAAKFYTERLGFRISDKFKNDRGVFLRSSGSPYHHNMFLIAGPARGLHHIAFAVSDFNNVVIGGRDLLNKGWVTQMGPGRHLIGSNYFWYFKSPCGGAMELTADMDYADDNWEAREWDFVPQNTAAWTMSFEAREGSR